MTVKVAVAGSTRTLTTDVARADVPRAYPDLGPRTGYKTVVPLPKGSHEVCVTVVNVGPGADRTFACRTATVTSGTATPAPKPAPAPTPTPAVSSSSRTLTWAPPKLTNPTTITVSNTNRDLILKAGQDYIVKMPSTPLEAKGGLIIGGGRNVVLIGGEIKISKNSTHGNDVRGLYLKGQSGTIHVEGLKITGAALAEGINLDQRNGATVQLQNIRVDTVHGSGSGFHADVLQTWAGPKVLRVDGLTGYTTYQGFFLTPQQYGPLPDLMDLRNVNLVGQAGSKYLAWRDGGAWPLKLQNVWASTSQISVPRTQFLRGDWANAQSGVPTSGDIVPSSMAGTRYASPGYTG
ncbi:hypothetical protein [Cellulomonas sp. ATA003]|uniref:hypothetical protein n=1 Tax=Cellulomonas sp. ATA003 TaxID=3073064 RepID=UPI002873952F|nr:hypothetical protein [Cellulomonas sp. ATA003]WNB85428.1 hypothetical protein REH70_17890 [Cellulomonas sp. ATA003]